MNASTPFRQLTGVAKQLRENVPGRKRRTTLRFHVNYVSGTERASHGFFTWDGTQQGLNTIIASARAAGLQEPHFTLYATHTCVRHDQAPCRDVTAIVRQHLEARPN